MRIPMGHNQKIAVMGIPCSGMCFNPKMKDDITIPAPFDFERSSKKLSRNSLYTVSSQNAASSG